MKSAGPICRYVNRWSVRGTAVHHRDRFSIRRLLNRISCFYCPETPLSGDCSPRTCVTRSEVQKERTAAVERAQWIGWRRRTGCRRSAGWLSFKEPVRGRLISKSGSAGVTDQCVASDVFQILPGEHVHCLVAESSGQSTAWRCQTMLSDCPISPGSDKCACDEQCSQAE